MKPKKILCVFLILCVMAFFAGCTTHIPNKLPDNSDAENAFSFVDVMVGDTNLEEWHENNVITRVTWQKLKLSDDCKASYPSLSDAFDKYNEESLTDAKALMYEFEPMAAEMEGDEFYPAYCTSESEIYVQRADNRIVSIFESVYAHTGGAHPNYYVNGINLNPHTGEETKLEEVLTNTKDLPSVLSNKITEKYQDVAFYDLEGVLGNYKPEDFTWTADYQGVTFWFAPSELAAFAAGTLCAKLWFSELPEMFNHSYTQAPENYVVSLPFYNKLDFDLIDTDNTKDSIYIEKNLDQYGSYNILSVTVNDKTCTDEINYAYDFDVYLAHMGDKNYIYSDSLSDNDYHMFCTWDINGDVAEVTDELYGTEIDYEYVEEGFEDGTVYKQAFNNPEFLKLETRFEILGTRGATATYKLSETDGKPEMTDEAYTFNYGHDVKTAIPLEAKLLPDMNKTELPVGTSLTPYQTDGKTFVDLKTESGSVVRLNIDVSDWPVKVNDIPEDECFEELLYAG